MYKLLFNLQFYINNYITYIYINKLNKINLTYNIIINYIKILFTKKLFNFRNKLNFNKSGNKIFKKKSGHARISDLSSHILKKGIIWFGFRNAQINKQKIIPILNKLSIYLLFNKRSNLIIYNLEIIKFLYNITNNINFIYNNIINISKKNYINFIYYNNIINNYKNILLKNNNINFIY
uniref:Ribosomal protein L4 n=1 Tax=Babesia duncani TaxID=323732 RepID=A0A385GNJ2_9APIC|nr:ribosomal protein L4 [Babesia duncani]